MGCFEDQFSGVTDRNGEGIKVPATKPTLKQSICAWGLINELVEIGYPHNFQCERSDIRDFMYAISSLIDKALKIQEVK
jgi:hypothetical protein